MDARDGTLKHLDKIAHEIIDDWYERSKENYVTQEDSLQLGVEPEVKRFHRKGNHRVKFARRKELDVTYGLGAYSTDGMLMIEASVNNKSAGFDYDLFVEKLKAYYWGSRHEKPWTDPEFDHFSYADLVHFDPRMSPLRILGHSQGQSRYYQAWFCPQSESQGTLDEAERPSIRSH